MAKVSIVIPLYNKASYITKALDSVMAQTFTDWECLIINDGSTDNSAQIVEDWISSHFATSPSSPFSLLTQANAGVSAARNRGIAESKGDYLAFLDADDWWEPNFIAEMVELISAYPDAGIYASNYIYWKPGKTRVGVKANVIEDCRLQIADCTTAYINYPKAYYENGEQVVWTGATIIDRLKIENCRLENSDYFPTGVKLGEDFLLWARIAMRYKVAFLNKPLAYYNNELTGSLRLTGKLHKPEANMLWHLDEIVNCRLKEDWKRLLDKLRVGGLLEYWLDDRYHDMAATELKKVEVPLPKVYRQPIWWVKLNRHIWVLGSYCKQRIVKSLIIKH